LEAVRKIDAKPVVQEFIVGLALSLEVLSRMGVGQPLQITGLEFDAQYGCKRVYAPVEIPEPVEASMNEIGREIASRLDLHGLTDVQALLKGSAPRVNEINARLPSQTPTVVYQSAGINMLELLVDLFVNDRLGHVEVHPRRAALYQHVQVSEGKLRVQGEHIMANASGLRIERDFMGADEAITNLGGQHDAKEGVATLIVTSNDLQAAKERMAKVVERTMREFELERYSDPAPERGESS
jgi:pyrrolysine biosynthesis protein PylC